MSIFDVSPAGLLVLIKGKILELPLKQVQKQFLLDDVDRASSCLAQGNTQCVLNCLNVIINKLNAKFSGKCSCIIKPLLADILILQQKLILQ